MSCELSGPAGTPDENELIKTAAALLPCVHSANVLRSWMPKKHIR